MTTRAPRSARISAVRFPIPLDAPVTTATLSSNSAMSRRNAPIIRRRLSQTSTIEERTMPPEINNLLQLLLRWAHVVAGVIWIGHLYFFNWVNAHFAKALDGPTKKIVVPELMPRALYWFRWGAAWTWITGVLLAGLVYYHGRVVFEDPTAGNPGLWFLIFVIIIAVGFVVYNAVMK